MAFSSDQTFFSKGAKEFWEQNVEMSATEYLLLVFITSENNNAIALLLWATKYNHLQNQINDGLNLERSFFLWRETLWNVWFGKSYFNTVLYS